MSKMETPENNDTRPPLALIAGPTASGKSGLAVKLAQALAQQGRRGVVVNADSAQVYTDLKVLSARPGAAETQGIEHRLYGEWDGADSCSAADWARAARSTIAELHRQDAVPILCGGTGLYMRTLLKGIAPVPEIDPLIRKAVRAMLQHEARKALATEDPQAAAAIAPADRTRTARALEVVRSTGRTLAGWQEEKIGGIGDAVTLHPLILLPNREALYERCDTRFDAMLKSGAIAEVEALLTRDLDAELPIMRAIGVRDIGAWLRGDIDRDTMVANGQQATRNYAKRQFTWFRNQPPERWPREQAENVSLKTKLSSLLQN